MAYNPKHSIAIDFDGSIMPMTPAEVQQKLDKMMHEGELVAAVVVTRGEVGVQVFGPPSEELLEILQHAAKGYKKALRRARGATH